MKKHSPQIERWFLAIKLFIRTLGAECKYILFTVPHLIGPSVSYVTGLSSELKLYDPPSHQESKAACKVNAYIHRIREGEKETKAEETENIAVKRRESDKE